MTSLIAIIAAQFLDPIRIVVILALFLGTMRFTLTIRWLLRVILLIALSMVIAVAMNFHPGPGLVYYGLVGMVVGILWMTIFEGVRYAINRKRLS